MDAIIFYRKNSESEMQARNYARDFEMKTGRKLEPMEVDSKEGLELARLYDIVQYPAILVRAKDGKLLQMWQGEPLPLNDEVVAYI